MRYLDNRSHMPHCLRPKGADIDKPEGAIKRLLRRKWRSVLKRSIQREGDFDMSDTKIFNPDWIKSIGSVPSGGVTFFGYDRGTGKDKSVKVGVAKIGDQYYVKSVG